MANLSCGPHGFLISELRPHQRRAGKMNALTTSQQSAGECTHYNDTEFHP